MENAPLLPLASVWDLADWIGEPINGEVDERRAEMCLRMASAVVRAEVGRDFGEVPAPEVAVMVTLYCASRIFENREAVTRESVDDYAGDRVVAEAGAYLTASEKAALSPLRQGRRFGGLGVVSTARDEVARVDGWVPTPTPGVYFPWYGGDVR